MRVADLIVDVLIESGVHQSFMVTGGGAMHLNDAITRNKKFATLFCHHEQACSIAAESYARLIGVPALVNVTSGPGGINALNGVFGAYVDSIPMIVVSGQVKRETLVSTYELPLRQLGDQEADVVEMVRGICKFAVQLSDPRDTRFVVEKAYWMATHGRPGPVWIDVPIDVQAAPIEDNYQRSFFESDAIATSLPTSERPRNDVEKLMSQASALLEQLRNSKRPVVLAGAGVRISGAHHCFMQLVEKLGVPVVTGWNAHDAIWNDHPNYVGRPGTVGDRPGNFAVQNADFLLVLGSRLNIRQIGYDFEAFAPDAFLAMVDIDDAELGKPTLNVDLPIHADLATFLPLLLEMDYQQSEEHHTYLDWCRERVTRYPVVLERFLSSDSPINPYAFVPSLFDQLVEGDVVVTGDGTACVVTFQAAKLKQEQRLYTNSGCASMGYDLPAAIGAAVARAGQRIICLAGDGSIMMNLQELQTIASNQLPIKIFVLNNNGYSSIRQTQTNYFSDNIAGCGPESGLEFPNFVELSKAFGIPSARATELNNLSSQIAEFINIPGPGLLEVMLDPDQPFEPKLSSRQMDDGTMVSGTLDDLAPFLPRQEVESNMLRNRLN
jgi:acetolactate synthase I/II/III large subunit